MFCGFDDAEVASLGIFLFFIFTSARVSLSGLKVSYKV
jgi:hypothetical protein